MDQAHYYDANATCPPNLAAMAEAARVAAELWANPSSVHDFGTAAREVLEVARIELAEALNCDAENLILTSGGTESNNLALLGTIARLETASSQTPHVVTSGIEHPSVLAPLRQLETAGRIALSVVPPEPNGIVPVDRLLASIGRETRLVCLMLANNETGAIQPVQQLYADLAGSGVLIHCDAVQAAGKLALDLAQLGADTVAISAHKFGGPRGAGALYLSDRSKAGSTLSPAPILFGGGQESGLRPGTINTPGMAGMARALSLAVAELPAQSARLSGLRDTLRQRLASVSGLALLSPAGSACLPNTLCIALPERVLADGRPLTGPEAVRRLADAGFAVSAASACAAGRGLQESTVLLAAGYNREVAARSLRISLHRASTADGVERLASAIHELLHEVSATPASPKSKVNL